MAKKKESNYVDSATLRQRLIYGLMDMESVSPMFSVVLCWLMQVKVKEETGPIAATDGTSMCYDPKKFLALPRKDQELITCHEAFHGLNHHIRQCTDLFGPQFHITNPALALRLNAAQDLWTNTVLSESLFGTAESPYPIPAGGLHRNTQVRTSDGNTVYLLNDRELFDPNVHDWYWIYTKMHREWNGEGFSDDLDYSGSGGGDEEVAARAIHQGVLRAEAERQRSSKQHGAMPGWMNILLNLKAVPQVRWQEKLRQTFNGSLPAEYSLRRMNKTYLGMGCCVGTISRPGMGTIVVATDTSGSVSREMLEGPVAEAQAIMDDVRPERLLQIWADAGVASVQEIYPGETLDPKPCGGGGTDFRPVFDYVRDTLRNDVDYVIYATDGYGTFPDEAPPYPVIWLVMKGGMTDGYPFGAVIDLSQ